jgi:hypothetical protein
MGHVMKKTGSIPTSNGKGTHKRQLSLFRRKIILFES